MPVDNDKKVNFTTTLFALIRENLAIKMRPGTFQKLAVYLVDDFNNFFLLIFHFNS